MFRGYYEHTADHKGRVSFPAKFRESLVENYGEELILTHYQQCVMCYPLEEWEKLERKIAELPQFQKEVQFFKRYFLSGATETTFDKQGRILIPNFLRVHAGIDKDVVFVGMLKKIEIWSKKNWSEAFQKSELEIEEVAKKLAELGI